MLYPMFEVIPKVGLSNLGTFDRAYPKAILDSLGGLGLYFSKLIFTNCYPAPYFPIAGGLLHQSLSMQNPRFTAHAILVVVCIKTISIGDHKAMDVFKIIWDQSQPVLENS